MSWQPRIINPRKEDINSSINKSRREDTTSLEDLSDKNYRIVGSNHFICPECGEGWTFARMKSITCYGTDSNRHEPILYYKDRI